ncbi:MAG: Mur ligase family protein, partial [Thermomicrobiales bacterium]
MKIVETRVLEGPNLFLLEPAVKIEFASDSETLSDDERRRLDRLAELVVELHAASGLDAPRVVLEPLEIPSHVALAYSWTHRHFATAIAEMIGEALISGADASTFEDRAISILAEVDEDDKPHMVSDAARTKLTIGVTGTNGKTTTTRLIAHLFSHAGRHVGWSCSSGVYIDGSQVLSGDYSGPQGAQRVLEDPVVEVAVVELARGGILLKGIACQSLDVSVFTNISTDHLDLQGIRTIRGLARAKSVVSRITRAGGFAVVNADDPLVMESTEGIVAERVLISRNSQNPVLGQHLAGGGKALVYEADALIWHDGIGEERLAQVVDVPMTYGGAAGFMVENALAGAAAALMAGLSLLEVRRGLATFDNSSDMNPGRLNVFEVDGTTVVLDFAHNEVGLQVLLDFARSLKGEAGEIFSVVGTAGDRTDESIRELGRIAALSSDHIIAKDTKKYLRGREAADLLKLYADGAH